MSVTIAPLEPDSRDCWDGFVRSHPDGTFFHLSGWSRVLERAFGHETHFRYAVDRGRVVGVLPLARVRSRLFGDALVSTPFCVYGGALAEDDRVRAALEDWACELGERLGVDHVEFRNRVATRSEWPTKELYVTFRKPITASDESNLNAIPRKQRAMVRKGIAAGLTAEVEPDARTLYEIYSESVRNLGTPVFGRSYLDVLLAEFREASEVTVVRHQGRPLAAVLSFYFRDEVLPYYGGSLLPARSVAGNDFMYWDVMRRAAARGVRTFDYGRSKLGTGSFSFKEHWGFAPTPLAYQYRLVRAKRMPNLSPTNPRYQRAIELWRRMPLRLTQWIGPPLARYLG